jgi:protein-S-isoprenylcysteine O-methyltransferase Ste14
MKHVPPIYLFYLIILSILFNWLLPIYIFQSTTLGIILIIVGLVPAIWINMLFKKNNTSIRPHEKPTKLTLEGPFKLSRNPIYLGGAIILFGVALILGTLISFFSPIVFILIMNSKFVPIEERNLEAAFGKEYIIFKKKVKRWL